MDLTLCHRAPLLRVTVYMGTVVYFESIPYTLSCYHKYKSTAENSLQQVHCLFLFILNLPRSVVLGNESAF